MKQIRRKILHQMYRNPQLRKAIAFSLFVKSKAQSSTVKGWSVNKLHELTGVSASAIRQRLSVLRQLNLIEEVGKREKCLVFKSLKSHTSHRNAIVPEIKFTENTNLKKNAYAQEIKQIEKTLSIMLIVEIQSHKNYANQMIQQSKNPNSLKNLKDAKIACKRLGYGRNFHDNGISYKFMAAKFGACIKTTFELIKFAIQNNVLRKINNTKKVYMYGIHYAKDMLAKTYTFIKGDSVYKVYSNRYVLVNV